MIASMSNFIFEVPDHLDGGPWPFLMMRTPYDVGPYGADPNAGSLGPSRAADTP